MVLFYLVVKVQQCAVLSISMILWSISEFAKAGKPMFGTCAGMILLANNLIGYEESHIGVMDITVERNSFGRQRDSFEAALSIKDVAEDFIGVFIRAPISLKCRR